MNTCLLLSSFEFYIIVGISFNLYLVFYFVPLSDFICLIASRNLLLVSDQIKTFCNFVLRSAVWWSSSYYYLYYFHHCCWSVSSSDSRLSFKEHSIYIYIYYIIPGVIYSIIITFWVKFTVSIHWSNFN